MTKAMELGSTSFVPPYYHGMFLLRGGLGGAQAAQEAIKSFEKATAINTQFAPAFEGLAQAYSLSPETQKPAVQAGIQAAKLEPANHAYVINLVYLLLKNDRVADARQLAQRLEEKGASAQEKQTAQELLNRIKERERWVQERKAQIEAAANVTPKAAVVSAPATAEAATSAASSVRVDTSTLMAVDGAVRGIDCSHKPAVTVTLSGGNRPLIFHASDFGAVGVTGKDDVPGWDACEKWKGRRIRVWFHVVKGKEYMGEITDLAFQ